MNTNGVQEPWATVAERLRRAGVDLPAVPAPAANYVPAQRHNDLIYTAGQVPFVDGALVQTGRVGADVSRARASELASIAALNCLAAALSLVRLGERLRPFQLTVYVASTPDFAEHHMVANGASDIIVLALGADSSHARTSVGVAGLPLNSPVEVQALFIVEPALE